MSQLAVVSNHALFPSTEDIDSEWPEAEKTYRGSHVSTIPVSEGRRSGVRFFDLGDEFLILVELPGATEAELSVQANRELVRIRAHHTDVLPRNMRSVIDERTPLRFNQSIKLYCPIDPDAVRAQYAQGVLELRLPKMAHAPSDITIREL